MPVRFEPTPEGTRNAPAPSGPRGGNPSQRSFLHSYSHDDAGARDTHSTRVSENLANMVRHGEPSQTLARRAAARIYRPNHVFSRVSSVAAAPRGGGAIGAAGSVKPAESAAPRAVRLERDPSDRDSSSMYWWSFLLLLLVPIVVMIMICCCCGNGGSINKKDGFFAGGGIDGVSELSSIY